MRISGTFVCRMSLPVQMDCTRHHVQMGGTCQLGGLRKETRACLDSPRCLTFEGTLPVSGTYEVTFELLLEAGLENRTTCDLTHVNRTQFPDLRGNAVLLNEWLTGDVNHQRIISREGNVETFLEKARKGIFVVPEESKQATHKQHVNHKAS